MRTRLLAVLVLFSGCSALIYQVAWLRLLRLIFGTSTAATAAVMAVFLGGLGIGALVIGHRADKSRNPIRLYAYLEMGVAVAAALSPLLIALIRMIYVSLGGTAALGAVGGTALRLFLSAIVLGIPTLLMGGTLPAVVRAAESAADVHRRSLGFLYGMNTLGAVIGTLAATFIALEKLGVRATIWSAALLNLIVAIAALSISKRMEQGEAAAPEKKKQPRRPQSTESDVPIIPTWLVLVAAGVVGFAFLVMELVWYRMMAPLLGGSTYTFGLILAVALFGIGIGGILYAVIRNRPTPFVFAFTCALEAFFIAAPFAFGDRIALYALGERQAVSGFGSLVWGWSRITFAVVFPAAAVAGYQFPLLVALLGRGRDRVGSDVGRAYATNTLGAIVGSLAGGFGLMPLLTAPRIWQWSVYLLAVLSIIVALITVRKSASWLRGSLAIVPAVLAIVACQAQGPTAFWRHSPIGAGRMQLDLSDKNAVTAALNARRLEMFWEADGVESAVGLDRKNGFSFDVNGKSDGSAIGDAPTQVMLGLLGAALHPNPKRALVIGLGTGETAGWLAQVPSIERVDVFELEPALLNVAKACAPTNRNALANPKVHVMIGDARELLQTTNATYDLIASDPSNPYRAGIASLFTREFYNAVAARLRPSGIFVQWMQAYEVRSDAMRSIVATLGSVFPSVETWELSIDKDLGFVASRNALTHDVARTRARVETEPYRSALALVWGTSGAEGLYSGLLGDADFAPDYQRGGALNTDDKTYLEFAFARSLGDTAKDVIGEMHQLSVRRGRRQPRLINGSLDWGAVDERRVARVIAEGGVVAGMPTTDQAASVRQEARYAYARENLARVVQVWQSQPAEPSAFGDVRMLAESFATMGDHRAPGYIEKLRPLEPVEAEAVMAVYSARVGDSVAAVNHFIEALRAYRVHPWANRALIIRAFSFVGPTVDKNPSAAARVFAELRYPFAARALDITRLEVRSGIGLRPGFEKSCVEALAPLEPNVPWDETLLRGREACYTRIGYRLGARARDDLEKFLDNAQSR